MPYRNTYPYYYYIQTWNPAQPTGQSGTALTSAETAYNSAYSNFITKRNLRDQALSAWQNSSDWDNDIALSGDRCGKKVSSCKLRHVDSAGESIDNALPFGAYPGIGTILV